MQSVPASYWPIPIAGVASLVHPRFRRYLPRRLPPLSPLKPIELYAAAGLAGSVVAQQQRFFETVKRDRDLLVLDFHSVAFRGWRVDHRAESEGMAHLHTEMWRAGKLRASWLFMPYHFHQSPVFDLPVVMFIGHCWHYAFQASTP